MLNKVRSFLRSNTKAHVGSLIASIILITVVLIPAIGRSVITGFLYVPHVSFLLTHAPYVIQGVVAVMFGGVVAILFYLLRIKNSLLISGVGLSLGYVLLFCVNQAFGVSVYLKAVVFLSIALFFFYGLIEAGKRLRINTFISAVVFIVLLGSCMYVAQVIEKPIEQGKAKLAHQAYLDAQNQEFESAKHAVDFIVYYPTYNSVKLPASELKLNGYSQDRNARTNPHVTFKLGRAMVTQSALLKNQEKLMDFTRNCDIVRLSQTMDSSSEVSQRQIEDSLENLSRCKIVHQTPTGKNVFFRESGQWTTFYLQNEGTNIVIEFDDINTNKYTDALLPEVNKIIDSLQPVSIDKLQRGGEMLTGRY